jgi:MFS family permease
MATPCFVLFGWLSDKVGRKWIMLIGMLAAVLTYRPIYKQFLSLTSAKNRIEKIDLSKTTASEPKVVIDAKDNTKIYVTQVFDTAYTDGARFKYSKTDTLHLNAAYDANLKIDALNPSLIVFKSAKPNVVIEKTMDDATYWNLIWLVFIQIVYVTMVYGPIAAFLVELFPTKIRYTSMSLPYHIGNGVFGGLVPFLGTLIVEFTKSPESPMGDALAGLWYPIGVASVCLVIGVIYLSNKIDKNVMD